MRICKVFILLSSLPVFLQTSVLTAQPFEVRPDAEGHFSFRQYQRGFNEWRQVTDLSREKNWKYLRRWEQEVQYHTDGSGEVAGTEDYLKALVEHASTSNVTFRSASSGLWYPVGPFNVPVNQTGYMQNGIGRVNCTAFHPTDPNKWYVGVAQGGLWRTTDDGASYTPLTDNLPINRISDIAINPVNPDVIYISLCDFEYVGVGLGLDGRKRHTHYGLGVYKSVNGGNTWSPTGLSFQLDDGDRSLIRKIVIDPSNTNRLLACGVGGMFRSVDGGASWTNQLDSLFWDMLQDPANPQKIYAATGWVKNANKGSAGIYVSNDFGLTWNLLPTGIPARGTVQRVKLAQSAVNPSRLYALTVDTRGGLYAVYRSDNGGTTWYQTSNTLNLLGYNDGTGNGGQGNYDIGFYVHPRNPDVVYAGGINLWASTDGAQTFNPASYWTSDYGPSIHADIHDLRAHPLTGQWYVSNDGGVDRTDSIQPVSWNYLQNGGTFPTLWEHMSDGMNVTSFYRLSGSRNTNGQLVAGAQDNATVFFDGTVWSTVYGGDGMDNVMDSVQGDSFVASYQFGRFAKTYDGGASFAYWSPNLDTENAEWTTPIVQDPFNPQGYYIGFENVVKSSDDGMTWASISSFPSAGQYGSELCAITVSRANPGVIYAARRVRHEYGQTARLFRTSTAGNSWSDITPGLPDSLYFTSVEADPSDVSRAYVSMAGLVAGHKVFRTGTAGVTWSNISFNLPNVPVTCVRVVPGSDDLLAATDIGVYLLPAGDTVWVEYGTGLPNVIVSDIEFNPALNKVYVSTFGRGLWATDLSVLASNGATPSASSGLTLQVHPNPGNGLFTLTGDFRSDAELTVVDVNGRLVLRQPTGKGVTRFRISSSPGLYFAVVRDGGKMSVSRFVLD
ncbi:MAG: hypothetical protein RL213_1732 [Bacteroidota bacterium]|jgi:hypothetical protein